MADPSFASFMLPPEGERLTYDSFEVKAVLRNSIFHRNPLTLCLDRPLFVTAYDADF